MGEGPSPGGPFAAEEENRTDSPEDDGQTEGRAAAAPIRAVRSRGDGS